MGNIATFEYGYTTTAADKGEFRFIQTGDIDKYGNILEQENKYIDLPKNIDENKYLLNKENIITARHGNCGRTAIFQSNKKTIFTNDLIRINFNQKEILPKYYWFFAQTRDYWEQVNNSIKGTAQPQFNANSLKEIKIPIPNLEKQKSIIANWEEKKRKILANQEETIKLLKEDGKEILNNLW